MDTLVLDFGFQPVDRIGWQQAIRLMVLGKIEVLEEYADRVVRSARQAFKIPSVIRLLTKVTKKAGVRFSRENVWLRDKGKCQYCGIPVSKKTFTYDHVVPRTLGGQTRWDNIVIACYECNHQKAGHTPEQAGMRLRTQPVRPKHLPSSFKLDGDFPKSWLDYVRDAIYWHSELEES